MARQRATSVQELMKAAARVFERKGYVDATIEDIAAEAGVSRPTVYQYVPSKQRLLESIVEQVIYPLRASVDEILASEDSSMEKLTRYIRAQVTSAVRYKTYYAVLTADQHQLSPQALRNYQSWAREIDHAAVHLFEECIRDGTLRADIDVPVMINLINSMLTSVGRWYRSSGPLGPDQIIEQVLKLLAGLLAPASGQGLAFTAAAKSSVGDGAAVQAG